MTSYRIVSIRIPETAEGPVPVWLVAHTELEAAVHREALGHEDLITPPDRMFAPLVDQREERKHVFAAVAEDAVTDELGLPTDTADYLGFAFLGLPLTDNLHLAFSDVAVAAEHRGRGIGTALWKAAEQTLRQAGRTTVTAWSINREPAEGEERLIPPTESGVIAVDAISRFAVRHGFTLEQVERHSTLVLPVAPEDTAAWQTEAQQKAGPDYRLVQWADDTPAEWLDALAELYRRMSVDVPQGGLELEEEAWDAERVRRRDQLLAKAKQDYVLTAAEHVPSRRLVAFTIIKSPQGKPAAYQDETLVHGEHRGKRLGLWVKAANLEYLAREHPKVERIHTWNADENEHMLAINVRIGFRAASLEGAWQRKLLRSE
ncbi:GNAT family N-acetyltransferase [Nesterenkonia muleiensis]|uniref:GNAT family N-acetyltransferase n=1 Tax=Nesterenkonia muleiensis TaxID=2282648 RepID=UPI000E764D6D|nr:GNAT family N-acetyltransferase [Nesterenkonia muleiensis]